MLAAQTSGAEHGQTLIFYATLPVAAPQAIQSADVTVAGSVAGASCSGTAVAPTAPEGMVCMYPVIGQGLSQRLDVSEDGGGQVGEGSPYGFALCDKAAGAGLLRDPMAWAYTAPDAEWQNSHPSNASEPICGGLEMVESGGVESKAEQLARAQHPAVVSPTGGQVAQGRTLYESACDSCHGLTGEGETPITSLPRTQSITGVLEQLIEPVGEMPEFFSDFTFEEKESIADFVTVEIAKTVEESH